jgi:hypothetical protein
VGKNETRAITKAVVDYTGTLDEGRDIISGRTRAAYERWDG